MVARTDLWVYNAENLCVSFFNQVASIFYLGGGKIKRIGAYLIIIIISIIITIFDIVIIIVNRYSGISSTSH